MVDSFRNQLLLPRTGMRFLFESDTGKAYEIFIINADNITVYYQYLHNDAREEVPLEQWQQQIMDRSWVATILELTR